MPDTELTEASPCPSFPLSLSLYKYSKDLSLWSFQKPWTCRPVLGKVLLCNQRFPLEITLLPSPHCQATASVAGPNEAALHASEGLVNTRAWRCRRGGYWWWQPHRTTPDTEVCASGIAPWAFGVFVSRSTWEQRRMGMRPGRRRWSRSRSRSPPISISIKATSLCCG